MSLDIVVSQRLREPTPWELAQWRSATIQALPEWEQLLDVAHVHRWDESTLRCVDNEARRVMPAPAAINAGPRPNVFRALFRKNIGGVSGVSDVWLDANLTLTDPGSGKLQSWIDYIDDTHVLTQGVSGSQAAVPSSDAALSSSLSASFAGGQYYVSNRAAASWQFLHDGSGADVIGVFVPANGTQAFLNTYNSSTAPGAVFFTLVVSGGTGNTNTDIYRSGGAAFSAGGLGTFVAGTGTYLHHTILSGASNTVIRQKSTTLTTGTLTSPAASPGAQTLVLGRFASLGTTYLTSRVRAVYVFRRALGSAGTAIMRAWVQRDTGVIP